MDEEEKKYRKVGIIISLSVHACLALLFFFLLAWQEPDPPLPEYGIELNFGTDNTGSGEAPEPKPTKTTTPTPPVKQEVVEPEPEEPQEETQEQVEEVQEENAEVTQPQESPVVQKEVTPTPPVEKPAEEKKEKTPAPKPQPKVDDRSLYPAANQGDDTDKSGDKGDKDGKIDERALYGAKGAANGTSLDMAGWKWDFLPKPNDPTSENGIIVFQITIDDSGYIINVKTLEKTVSPRVEKIYREAVEQLSFSKTSDNIRPAPTSTGKITFVIKSK